MAALDETKAYRTVTLPDKRKVPVRDYYLDKGRKFSVQGDVSSPEVMFDGKGNVTMRTTIGSKAVKLNNISPDAIATEVTQGDNRLVTAGAVAAATDIGSIPLDVIDSMFVDGGTP